MATVWLSRQDCVEGALPGLCLKCGRPAGALVEQDFFGTLLWGDPASFLSAPAWEPAKLRVPLCEGHRRYWRDRRLAAAAFVAALFAGAVGLSLLAATGSLGEDGLAYALGGTLLAAFLFSPLFLALPLGVRALEIHERGVRLTGVSDVFARAHEATGRDD